ncbi:TPA: pilus assembly protein PilC [Candidatus Saccharibacteria bacterium]|nr:pilus assembly protein PilC [Candidatus Saccharibacteria bacterium]HRJ90623.1 type II secretion system F family protein [Candidatus Saccharibacteria bacterium]
MKRFNYEAKDLSTGKIVKASVQADTESAAAKLLLSQGFTPQNITEASDDGGFLAKYTGRITTKDKVVFSRQMATLIGAGLPLTQSLRTVHDQTENKKLQAVIDDIIAAVEGGKSLSDSFSQHTEVFDNVFLALVTAGEASGTLDQALKRIAIQQEKDAAMMSKIRGAMVYPAIVMAVILGVVVFMLVVVVPQVKKLYEDLGQTLPLITQIMVFVADFIINFGWLLIIFLGIGMYFFRQYLQTEGGIKAKDSIKLNVPLFGVMFRKLYMARFARTGQTLLNTGVPMLDMLKISAQAVNNTIVAASITRAAEKVKGGKALSEALKPEDYILPFVPQMINIGEQSGKIDEMMGKAAQVYEDELDEEIRSISTAIEPILMVVLAVVAGGLVGAILLPIYGLVNNVSV